MSERHLAHLAEGSKRLTGQHLQQIVQDESILSSSHTQSHNHSTSMPIHPHTHPFFHMQVHTSHLEVLVEIVHFEPSVRELDIDPLCEHLWRWRVSE